MRIEELIRDFSEKFKISVDMEEDGSCSFLVDGRHTVVCLPALGNEVVIRAEIADLSERKGRKEELLRRLLQLNLSRMHSENSVLALEADDRLLLFRRLPLKKLDADSFAQELENFLNSLDFWWQEASLPTSGPSEGLVVLSP